MCRSSVVRDRLRLLPAAPPKPFYTEDGPVPLVNADTFPTADGEYVTVVHFFHADADNEQVSKVMQSVAGKLSPSRIAKFAAVDCRAHATLCNDHGVAQTPAIQAFVPDDDEAAEFSGAVSPAALKAWTLRQVPSHVVPLHTEADLEGFLQVRALVGVYAFSCGAGRPGARPFLHECCEIVGAAFWWSRGALGRVSVLCFSRCVRPLSGLHTIYCMLILSSAVRMHGPVVCM